MEVHGKEVTGPQEQQPPKGVDATRSNHDFPPIKFSAAEGEKAELQRDMIAKGLGLRELAQSASGALASSALDDFMGAVLASIDIKK